MTNGSNAKQRLLLRNAAVQLEDEFGNAAPGGGVQVGILGGTLRFGLSLETRTWVFGNGYLGLINLQASGCSCHWFHCCVAAGRLTRCCTWGMQRTMQVRFRLRYQGEAVGSSGSQLPALQAAQGREQQETDERGRAFVGDLAIAEGSGTGQACA